MATSSLGRIWPVGTTGECVLALRQFSLLPERAVRAQRATSRGFVLLGTEHHFLSPKNKPARARQHRDKILNIRDYFYQFEPEAPYTEISKKLVRCALTCAVYSPSHMKAICQAKRTLFLPVEGVPRFCHFVELIHRKKNYIPFTSREKSLEVF